MTLRLIKERRFVEALYYGALELSSDAPPLQQFLLGLSCCAVIKPIADLERLINVPAGQQSQSYNASLRVGRDTTLVLAGYAHLCAAIKLDRGFTAPDEILPIIGDVQADLIDYSRQDFHGFSSVAGGLSRRDTAWKAIALLDHFDISNRPKPIGFRSFYLFECAKREVDDTVLGAS